MLLFRTTALATLAALAGCTNLRATYPTTASCVHDQFFDRTSLPSDGSFVTSPGKHVGRATFLQVVHDCGDPVPDLTGDTMIQAVAILYKVPFRIDLAKDTAIKQQGGEQIMTTGSLLPLPALIYPKS